MNLLSTAYLKYLFALDEGHAPNNSAAGFSFRWGKVNCIVLVLCSELTNLITSFSAIS